MKKIHLFCLLAVSLALLPNIRIASGERALWMSKIDATLINIEGESVEFLLILDEQGDVSNARLMHSKAERGQFVYETLTAVAMQTQAPIIEEIESLGWSYRSFWIQNMILVEGDWQAIQQLAQRPDIASVLANPQTALAILPTEERLPLQNQGGIVEWNLSKIRADIVWEMGITGQGVVIGGQDTGYNWMHPGLINQYRGWDGNTAVHDYNWHDTISSGGNSTCGSSSPEPCDDFFSTHGTHTMGTAVGTDGVTHTGVAPGAEWIGCRNMNAGNGSPATYTECYEWFVAPYPIGGDPMLDGDPSKAPHVINNSWSCPASEGCSPTSMQAIVKNVRAAGIVTVHSAGNSGPSCNTVSNPAGHFQDSFTVGST
ncbi:MAG: S8 family serine peptidase, partial [Chloroflexota bacterium]